MEFVNVTQGTGTKMAADQIGDVFHPRVKLEIGVEGTAADVSSDNPMPVTIGGGLPLKNYNENAGSLSPVTVASITLSVNRVYRGISWAIGCFQTLEGNLIYSNNSVEIILLPIMLSSSQNMSSQELPLFEFNTISATGPQLLIFKASNLDTPSTIRAMISLREFNP